MTAPRIVLLSNDSSSLSLMHGFLNEEGYRTLRCRPRDVTDAHAVVKRVQADLVILDLWLAERADGWAFLARMCADLATMHIPAIIASGQMEMLPQQDALRRTMQCQVLRTPFDADELLTAIERVLGPSPAARSFDAYVYATSHADRSVAAMPDDRLAVAARDA